jgi:predicted dehydrogenase
MVLSDNCRSVVCNGTKSEQLFQDRDDTLTNGRTLNVGVVGAGNVAAISHVPFLKRIRSANLVALADVDIQRAMRLSKMHGIPRATSDYRDLLRDDRIDIIDICTPPFTHEQIISDAASAGKQIIVEKPLAVGLPDALAIRNKLQEVDGSLGVVLNLRYMPLVQAIPRILHGVQFGQVQSVTATAHTFPPVTDWITRPPYDEYGVLYDYFPHLIDLVMWALQAMPVEVLCVRKESGRHHAFYVVVNLRLPSGGTLVMLNDLKWTAATSLRVVRFDAEERTLFVDLQDQFCQVTSGHITPRRRIEELFLRVSGLGKRVVKGRLAIRYGAMIYHYALLQDFLNDFRLKRGPKISVVDGIMHMAVIDAAVRSCREHRPIEIDLRTLL